MIYKPAAAHDQQGIIGECERMCSPDQEAYRKRINDINPLEKIHPVGKLGAKHNRQGESQALQLIQRYERSASGSVPLPKNIRTVDTLLRTTNYLLSDVFLREDVSFIITFNFTADRLRAIDKEFILQGIHGKQYITFLQNAIRFMIISPPLCWLADDFVVVHHHEQLSNYLMQLLEEYSSENIHTEEHQTYENQAEFYAYALLHAARGSPLQFQYVLSRIPCSLFLPSNTHTNYTQNPIISVLQIVSSIMRRDYRRTLCILTAKENLLLQWLWWDEMPSLRARLLQQTFRDQRYPADLNVNFAEFLYMLCLIPEDFEIAEIPQNSAQQLLSRMASIIGCKTLIKQSEQSSASDLSSDASSPSSLTQSHNNSAHLWTQELFLVFPRAAAASALPPLLPLRKEAKDVLSWSVVSPSQIPRLELKKLISQ